ncbi:MAG: Rpn family recombination-promoting nuclease/putative transposase [Bacillota bacterium]
MKDKLKFPHDTGYKYLLSYRNVFLELLDCFVDQGWVKQLDRNQIILVNKSFVLPEFVKKESDLIYQLKENDREVIFYLLLELQSSVDFQMPYRLLLYMAGLWYDYVKGVDRKIARRKSWRLPVIVPLVLYNGKGAWTAGRSFKQILAGWEQFGEYVLDFKYILIDVLRYPPESLIKLANLIGAVFFLERQSDFDECIRRMKKIEKVVFNFDDQRLLIFGSWINKIAIRNFPEEQREKLLKEFDTTKPEGVKTMITHLGQNFKRYFNEAEKKGEIKGILKGKREVEEKTIRMAQNLLAMGIAVETVAKAAELPVEKILELQKPPQH